MVSLGPNRLGGPRIKSEDVIIDAGVDDQRVVDRDVAVAGRAATEDVLDDAVGRVAAVPPGQVASHSGPIRSRLAARYSVPPSARSRLAVGVCPRLASQAA